MDDTEVNFFEAKVEAKAKILKSTYVKLSLSLESSLYDPPSFW